MAIGNSTKQSFANALKSLLHTKDLDKIRVTELCELCGAERPTFYYHFKDKYDLIVWIYEQDMRNSAAENGGMIDARQLERFLLIMRREENFYRKAFSDTAQNSLLPHILSANREHCRTALLMSLQTDALTPSQEFAMNFYVHAWTGCLLDWIFGSVDCTAEEFARLMYWHIRHLNLPYLTMDQLT